MTLDRRGSVGSEMMDGVEADEEADEGGILDRGSFDVNRWGDERMLEVFTDKGCRVSNDD